jgi:uncharacterized repeat protein (TIGR01451 family)
MSNNFISRVKCIILVCVAFGVASEASAITITRRSGAIVFTDPTSALQCSYAAYAISNDAAANYSNIWVKVDSFTGTVVRLAGGDPGLYALDDLPAGQTKMAYVFLQATNITATAQTHTVRVYNAYPTLGTQLTNVTFSFTSASPGANNSSKVSSAVYDPTIPTLGGFVTVTAVGDCGQVQNNDIVDFAPAAFTTWNASAFELVNASIWFTNKNNAITNISNFLELPSWAPIWSNGQLGYQAKYLFRVISVISSNTPLSPITLATQGQTETHTPVATLNSFAPIIAPTNSTIISPVASVSQLYTNELLTLTGRITNSGANDITLDRVVDTLPPGFLYVSGSSTFNGASILDPLIATNGNVLTLTWSETYTTVAGLSRDFSFKAMPTLSGYATNSLVAFTGSAQIDTTYSTSDNAPAVSVVRVLIVPTAMNDAASGLEDVTLTVSAPGVLANDIEPNGFAVTVFGYTQPSHGSVTVSSDGSFTYLAATNYNGSDSFTYTLTNGNARTATATVNLTITAVNDPPTLNALTNITVNENSIASVSLLGISAGPADESSQTLSITASSSNPALVPAPSVTYTSPAASGSLTITPVTCGLGQSAISVIVQDSGGTANNGVSAKTNTFVVTVAGVTNIWSSGGSLTVNITNATGSAGAGYSVVGLPANLDVQASSGSPYIINLSSIGGTTPGFAANFNYTNTYTWTVATTPCGITGFAANKFVVNNSQFSNDLAGGTFSAALSGDGRSVQVIYSPNHAPVANTAAFTRAYNTSMKIPISNFLSGYTSDPDGDATALYAIGSSTNGSFVGTNATYFLYAATNNLSESLRYVVRDLRAAYRPGDTILRATNLITITLSNAAGLARSITSSGNAITVSFAGVPNYKYVVERATSLIGPWTTLDGSNGNADTRTNAPASGIWVFSETPPFSPAFYRCRQNY